MMLKQKLSSTAEANTNSAAAKLLPKRRGYAGRSADQLAEERRQRLLAAALDLFSERGFSRTPIELLCSTAKVTTRHFYEHFDSREAVLVALYDRINVSTRATVAAALQAQSKGQSPQERMFAAVCAFIKACTEDPRCTRILCVEAVGVSPEMFERRRAAVHEFANVLNLFVQQLVQMGELPKRDYWRVCVAMVGAIRELMIEWLTSEEQIPVEALQGHLIRMIQALIAGARAMEPEWQAEAKGSIDIGSRAFLPGVQSHALK